MSSQKDFGAKNVFYSTQIPLDPILSLLEVCSGLSVPLSPEITTLMWRTAPRLLKPALSPWRELDIYFTRHSGL